jgi:aspartate-semialdehyde dehydrogenase
VQGKYIRIPVVRCHAGSVSIRRPAAPAVHTAL